MAKDVYRYSSAESESGGSSTTECNVAATAVQPSSRHCHLRCRHLATAVQPSSRCRHLPPIAPLVLLLLLLPAALVAAPPPPLSLPITVDGLTHTLRFTDADAPAIAVAAFCTAHGMTTDDCTRLKGAAHAEWLAHFNISSVRDQYEQYPYPPRDPSKEIPGELTRQSMPGMLSEINHWIFGGRLDLSRGTRLAFRALVVGCGTGDQAVMLAQHLALSHVRDWTLVCLDLSAVSLEVARARLERHGLMGESRPVTGGGGTSTGSDTGGRVHIVRGSLLDEDLSAYGPFHYVAAVGVLHHLDVPGNGLRALRRWLHPAGGMGIMVYGQYGRRGVYQMQESMRILKASAVARAAAAARARGDAADSSGGGGGATVAGAGAAEIAPPQLLRQLLADLPSTHPLHGLYTYRENVGRHWNDVELYDLFLHSTDQAYTVNKIAAFARDADLALVDLVPRAVYDPLSHVAGLRNLRREPGGGEVVGGEGRLGLRRHVDSLGWLERRSFAELVASDINMHTFFLVLPTSTTPKTREGDRGRHHSRDRDRDLLVGQCAAGVPGCAAAKADLSPCDVSVVSSEVVVERDVDAGSVPSFLFGFTAAQAVAALAGSREQRVINVNADRLMTQGTSEPVLTNSIVLPRGAIDFVKHVDGVRTVDDMYTLWLRERETARVVVGGNHWARFLKLARGTLEGLISAHIAVVALPPASLVSIVSARTATQPC